MSKRYALTDEQCERINNLLPGKPGDSGRTSADNRLFVDAVLFLAKTGCSVERRAGTVREVEQRLATV